MQISHHTSKHGHKIAYTHFAGDLSKQGIVFLHGFRSDMQGTKSIALYEYCTANNIPFTALDCYAHGQSEGDFLQFTISKALSDIEETLDLIGIEPSILVGSSMGGCLMLLTALKRPDLVGGLIGVAAAPDFTEKLMFARFDEAHHAEFQKHDMVHLPSEYDLEGYYITGELIRDGRHHLILDDVIPLEKPVHLLHGQEDADVPYEFSLKTAQQLLSKQVKVTLTKDGDHRLSRPDDISVLISAVNDMRQLTNTGEPR